MLLVRDLIQGKPRSFILLRTVPKPFTARWRHTVELSSPVMTTQQALSGSSLSRMPEAASRIPAAASWPAPELA
jgi:hypothetical protein